MANKTIKTIAYTILTIGTLGIFWAGKHLYNHNIKSPSIEENIHRITQIPNAEEISLDIGKYSIPGLFDVGRHNGAGIYYHGRTKDNKNFEGFVETANTLGRLFEMEKHGLKRAEEIAKKVELYSKPQGIEVKINRLNPQNRPYLLCESGKVINLKNFRNPNFSE